MMKDQEALERTVEFLKKRVDEKGKKEDAKILERRRTISLDRVLKIVGLRTLEARRECIAIARRSDRLASKPNLPYKRAAERLNDMMALEYDIEQAFLYNGSN